MLLEADGWRTRGTRLDPSILSGHRSLAAGERHGHRHIATLGLPSVLASTAPRRLLFSELAHLAARNGAAVAIGQRRRRRRWSRRRGGGRGSVDLEVLRRVTSESVTGEGSEGRGAADWPPLMLRIVRRLIPIDEPVAPCDTSTWGVDTHPPHAGTCGRRQWCGCMRRCVRQCMRGTQKLSARRITIQRHAHERVYVHVHMRVHLV